MKNTKYEPKHRNKQPIQTKQKQRQPKQPYERLTNNTNDNQLSMNSNKDQSLTVSRRHALFTVYATGNGTFRLTSLTDNEFSRINPGRPCFPWLSQIARAFTKYDFKRFELEYVPISGFNNNGQTTWYIDYEGRDPIPTNTMTMYDQKDVTTTAVFKNARKRYDSRDLMSVALQKSVKIDGDFNILDDCGVLYVATDGFSSVTEKTAVGVMYASYTVRLYIPQVNLDFAQVNSYNLVTTQDQAGYATIQSGNLPVRGRIYDDAWPEIDILIQGTYQIMIDWSYTYVNAAEIPLIQLDGETLVPYSSVRKTNAGLGENDYIAVFYLKMVPGQRLTISADNLDSYANIPFRMNISNAWNAHADVELARGRKLKQVETPIIEKKQIKETEDIRSVSSQQSRKR